MSSLSCLNLQVIDKTKSDLKLEASTCNVAVIINAASLNVPVIINTTNKNCSIELDFDNLNVPVEINTINKNCGVHIEAGLVCGSNLDKYEVLFVEEGPLMVEEGFLKVKKRGVLI